MKTVSTKIRTLSCPSALVALSLLVVCAALTAGFWVTADGEGRALPPEDVQAPISTPTATEAEQDPTAAEEEPEAAEEEAEEEEVLPEDDECMVCHESKSLSVERDGATVSLYVDWDKLGASVHAENACVDCHADLKGTELPHEKGGLARAECGSCHDSVKKLHAASLHGRALTEGGELAPLAPRCQDCHGSHEIRKISDPGSAVAPLREPYVCGRCHKEGTPVQLQPEISQHDILENYSESIHGEGLLKKGLIVAPTCSSCHTAHSILPHTDEASSISREGIAATCTQCHSMIEEVHRKIIKGELWEKEVNVLPACVDCHQPHKIRKVFYEQGMSDEDCLSCHRQTDLKAADGRLLYVDSDELVGSSHAKVTCSQCHSDADPSKTRPCEAIARKVDCSACHAEVSDQYQESIHGQLSAKSDPNAPTCLECHGTHAILGKEDSRSPTFPTKIPDLCARCHREGQQAAVRYAGTEREIVEHYTESIHGKGLLKSGLVVTATCTDCHTAHRELPESDPRSSIRRENIPATCGRCHSGIQEKFLQSIHATLAGHTDMELPTCSECHTAHTIRRTDETGFKLLIMDTCGRCHEEIAETYFDTYHGKVSQLGYTKTAKCYDCHGSHDVLPLSDPRSHLSRDNVVATCQKCHPGATRRFAGYLTHATHHDPQKYPFLFWTFWSMTTLLVGTFFFGGLHTLMWLPRAFLARRAHRVKDPGPKEMRFVRFSRLNRTLHILMIISFMSLAVTGMTLKFSYTGWAATLSRLLGGFESAGYIHRLGAVLMIGIFVAHLIDLVRRKNAEYGGSWKALLFGPNTMLPTRKDVSDFWSSLKWFLGLGVRPAYGRWTYWEKFDYFAVFWGIAVIGSTGLLLWFSEFFTQLIPGSFLNVATIIHSDEALLAVGFIFTIHFFNTHLRPEKFPMDIVVFTGQMTLEELKRDKPLEYERLKESGELEKRMVEAYQPIVTRTIRVFAWIALAIGFSMVAWIIYAMLFAYR